MQKMPTFHVVHPSFAARWIHLPSMTNIGDASTLTTKCILKTITPRQRRKRTDTRVAALEQWLAELQVETIRQWHSAYHRWQNCTCATANISQ
ncbi:hypothetical protein V8C37DRAFT_388008 [Trichoderma ceciliae]